MLNINCRVFINCFPFWSLSIWVARGGLVEAIAELVAPGSIERIGGKLFGEKVRERLVILSFLFTSFIITLKL